MAINKLTVGSVASTDYCIFPTNAGIYEVPKRSVEMIPIDGRDGDLTQDNERFENVEVTYPCAVYEDFKMNFLKYRAKLLAVRGYQKISDTFQPDYYRMGMVSEFSDIVPSMDGKLGRFEMVMNCMPQLWLVSGEQVKTITGNDTIQNPTDYLSKPLLRVYGHGKIKIGSSEINVKTAGNTFIDIDCQRMDATENGENRNPNIEVNSWHELGFAAGANNIQIDETITKIEITPRWYTI